MNPRLNRLITIEVPPTSQDSTYGTATGAWTALAYLAGSPLVAEKFWAEVQDVMPSRSESARQGLVVGKKQSRVRIRWRDDVTSAMRVTIHGDTDKVCQIIGGPAEVGGGRKRYLELLIEESTS
jgi:head-tail adaptor